MLNVPHHARSTDRTAKHRAKAGDSICFRKKDVAGNYLSAENISPDGNVIYTGCFPLAATNIRGMKALLFTALELCHTSNHQ